MFPTLSTELQTYEENLVASCEGYGVSLRVFKSIKAVVQLAAVMSGIIAIQNGADPLTSLLIIAMIYGGPEYLEYFLAKSNE